MAKDTRKDDSPRRRWVPRGKIAPVGLVIAAKSASLVAVAAVYYFIAFFVAVRVVPITMGFIKSGSGVTMDMPTETILAVWIAPSLFLIALIFAAVLVAMRKIWRLRARAVTAVSAWALGREDANVTEIARAGVSTKSKRAGSARLNKSA